MNPLKDKIVLVTGAAGGLGRAFALGFAQQKAMVIVADLNQSGAEATLALVKEHSDGLALSVDVAKQTSTQALAQTIANRFGRLDVLVNNAAIYAGLERKPFYEIEETEWDRVMDVNLKGVWLTTASLVPLLKQAAGKVVNIASATVMSGSPFWAHYVASKGGVIALTRVMAKELGEFNICVNAIAPGFTLTDASLNLMENASKYGVDRGAIKRPSTADDIVGTALYLSSPAADFVTGQTIIVDGGKQFL